MRKEKTAENKIYTKICNTNDRNEKNPSGMANTQKKRQTSVFLAIGLDKQL